MAAATSASDQAKAARAAKEKERRAAIKAAKEALVKAGLPEDTKLDPEQRRRAAGHILNGEKGGLTGKALATYITDGTGTGAQVAKAREEQAAQQKAERQRTNATRSSDPEATELAQKAKALAPEVKSAFLPKDAREFIDKFEQRKTGQHIVVKRTDVKDAEEVSIKRADLRKFAQEGEKDTDVRAALATLGKDSRLWGRKLGLFILASEGR